MIEMSSKIIEKIFLILILCLSMIFGSTVESFSTSVNMNSFLRPQSYSSTTISGYSFQTESPWPQSRNDLENHGNSNYTVGGSTEIWSFKTSQNPSTLNTSAVTSTPVIGKDGIVYFSAFDGNVYAMYPSGSLKWKYTMYFPGVTTTILAGLASVSLREDGSLIVCSEYLYVFFLNSEGKSTFAYEVYDDVYLEPFIISPPLVSSNGTIIITTENSYMIALSGEGETLWYFYLDGYYFVSPPAMDGNNTIYFGCNNATDDTLYYGALNENGTELWAYTNIYRMTASPVIGYNGIIYFVYNNAIDSRYPDSTQYFFLSYSFDAYFYATPSMGKDGTLYLPSLDGFIYVVSSNGIYLNQYRTNGPITSSPVIDIYGNVYAQTNERYLYAFDPTGSIIWKFFTNNTDPASLGYSITDFASSPAIGADNVLYIGSTNGRVYAIGAMPEKSNPSSSSSGLTSSDVIIISVVGGLGVVFLCFVSFFLVRRKAGHLKNNIAESEVAINYMYPSSDEYGQDKKVWSGRETISSANSRQGSNNHVDVSVVADVNFSLFWKPHGDSSKETSKNKSTTKSPSNTQNSQSQGGVLAQSMEKLINLSEDLRVRWGDLYINSEVVSDAVIGHGSFGTVIKAVWYPVNKEELPVAIKVITKSLTNAEEKANFQKICTRACAEMNLVIEADKKLRTSNGGKHLIKMYGIAVGTLPASLLYMFHLQSYEEGLGIVMRYEAGGSLESLIYKNRLEHSNEGALADPVLPMTEKLRLLSEIAHAIADIHSIKIVHGDIKPDNVLLSSNINPSIRLADFGLSSFRESDEMIGASSLAQTSKLRGTPIYCAPEMLVNPFEEDVKETVARASQKTDIYAFALLVWEFLAEKKPFGGIKSEAALCSKVHSGVRPPLSDLPSNTPQVIIDMITACWDKERSFRKSAVECLSILRNQYYHLASIKFDLCINFITEHEILQENVYHYLADYGYSVRIMHDLDMNGQSGTDMNQSKAIIVCVDRNFQSNPTFMAELKEIRDLLPYKSVITLVLEENINVWASQDLKNLCRIAVKESENHGVIDLSNIAAKYKRNAADETDLSELSTIEDAPDGAGVQELRKSLEPLILLLQRMGCEPSFKV